MQRINIQSVAQLLSVARLAAQEAAQNYAHLASAMRDYASESCAATFDQMAEREIEHEKLIVAWTKAEGIPLDPDVTSIDWEDPNVGTEYDAAARDPIRSTPYRVLSYVAHNEEHAFRFFSHVAANTDDETVREYAEVLAQEELGHAAWVRSMRRRAWHAERLAHPDEPVIKPGVVESMADFLAITASLERCVRANLAALLSDYPQMEQILAHSEIIRGHIEALAKDSDTGPHTVFSSIDAIQTYGKTIEGLTGNREGLLRRLYSDSDRCAMYYDALVRSTREEAIMLQAQRFSISALERIELLREAMGRLVPDK
jgi:rubrerythrin